MAYVGSHNFSALIPTVRNSKGKLSTVSVKKSRLTLLNVNKSLQVNFLRVVISLRGNLLINT
jgi:hypothetical protein